MTARDVPTFLKNPVWSVMRNIISGGDMCWIWVLLLSPLLLTFGSCGHEETIDVRPEAAAGKFYPEDSKELRNMVIDFLSKVREEKIKERIYGLVVPHAGYQFSGQVAAYAFKQLEDGHFDDIIVIGPSHYIYLDGASVGDWDFYETPLGRVKIDKELCDRIRKESEKIGFYPDAHSREHSVENEIPFLQVVLGDFNLVPIVMGNPGIENCRILSNALIKAIGNKRVLIVASSDMSHYPQYNQAVKVDHKTLDIIKAMDPERLIENERDALSREIPNLHCTLCGLGPVTTLLMTAKKLGAREAKILKYANSGDVFAQNRDRVVGYGAIAIYGHQKSTTPNNEQKKKLLEIARKTIEARLANKPIPGFKIDDPALMEKRGVFVTLTNHGKLRGCIGHFLADTPLYKIVSDMAIAASTQDYRFAYDPVTLKEMKDIRIEISILSPLRRIKNIDEIRMGIDGIYIRKGTRAGTFLPQVAEETGWTKREFLEHCCHDKAGLPGDAWKDPDTELYTYTAFVFHE